MKRNSKTTAGVTLAAVVILATSLGLARAEVSSNLHQVFPVSPGGKLSMHVDQGSIEVSPQAGDQVEVEVLRKVTRASDKKAQEVFAAHEVTLKQDGSRVTVEARLHRSVLKRGWLGREANLEVRYVISIPTNFNLDLNTAAGSIKVTGCEAEVLAKTSAGSIRLGEIHGAATLHTSAGSIHVGKITGALNARTAAGAVEVESAGSSVQAASSAGSVKVGFAGSPEADSELKTSAGSIRVRLGGLANLRLDAETSAGSVRCDLPVKLEGSKKDHHMVGTVGEGGPLLKLRTSAGSIEIER
jgi:DUF4097 and DUF4098 domain-containing protein YvlB